MKEKILYIKHVVCPRCIESVREILSHHTAEVLEVQLGFARVRIDENWSEEIIVQALEEKGFELLIDREQQVVNRIKSAIIDLVHYQEHIPPVKNSAYLAEKTGMSYSALTKIFSKHEGITIEKYGILQKVERVKELLSYGELSLKEIGDKLGYSSLQHISRQFKSVTGMSVSTFNKHLGENRVSISKVGNNHPHHHDSPAGANPP